MPRDRDENAARRPHLTTEPDLESGFSFGGNGGGGIIAHMDQQLEERLTRIEARNKKVETDKQWETSWTRRALLIIFTYLAIGLYLNAIRVPAPWLNAIVPAVGFLLSTLTLPLFKRAWIKVLKK